MGYTQRCSDGVWARPDRRTGGPQICQSHFRVFAREKNSVGAALKCSKRGIANTFRCASAMAAFGRNIDVDSGPEKGLCSGQAFARPLRFATNVVSRKPGQGDFLQRLLFVVQYAIVKIQQLLPGN